MKYFEINKRGTTIRVQDFSSIGEFSQYLQEGKANLHFKGFRSSVDGDYRFTKTHNYQEALDLFAKGWTEMAAKISKRLPVATAPANVTRSKPSYGMVGGQASVPRYIQGIPTNMVDRKPVAQKQKIIVINRDICYSAGVSVATILEEGIKALQLVQALENKGFRVKLNMVFIGEGGRETLGCRVTVKKPEERLALSKVAFPLIHPSMLRRILFRWLEVHPTMSSPNFVYGYGRPAGQLISEIFPKEEIHIPNFIPDVDKFIEKLGK